jgi:rod shape-determining protein MreC
MLMVLHLEGVVVSFKAVLAYVFLPQVRVAHETTNYISGVSDTVKELLDTHRENHLLKQEMEMNRLLASQAQEVLAENERLTDMLQLSANHRWKGVWAKVAYREPTQWNTVTIDKGARDGIAVRSAVISMKQGKEGLAGVVVEVTERTAKVLLLRDEEFSAAVYLDRGKEEGLLIGAGTRPLRIQYIPLEAHVEEGDKVYTSSSSSVFPAGIWVGTVSKVRQDDSFQTALTVQVEPAVRPSSVKEVFVISEEDKQ